MASGTDRVFDHVLIIVMENEYRSYVMRNPFMRALARKGIELANHFGVMHPSQTNYVSSVAGELCNITYDWPPYPPLLPQRTIANLLEEASEPLRWKAYIEGDVHVPWRPGLQPCDFAVPYPVPHELWATTPEPFKSTPQPLYPVAYWHNPFFAFADIMGDKMRWERIDNEAAFWRDLLTGDFPEFAWFTPNLWNDGHYLYGTADEPPDRTPLVDQQADWLQRFFASLRFPGPDSRLPPRTLVVVTYDEADFDAAYDHTVVGQDGDSCYDGPNQIYTVLLGDMITPGVQSEGSNHYTLLKTVEKNFGLPSLGKNDDGCNWWQFLWDRKFQWAAPDETPVEAAMEVAAAALGDTLYVLYSDRTGAVKSRTRSRGRWTKERDTGATTQGGLAAASHAGGILMVVRNAAGGLDLITFDPESGWQDSADLVDGPVSAFSLAALDSNGGAMLAYADESGALYSLVLSDQGWCEPVSVGQKTDGDITLAVLGATVLLVHKAPGCDQMNAVSYNLADFNVVTPPGGNQSVTLIDGTEITVNGDTTQDLWSPTASPVAFFWRGQLAREVAEDDPRLYPFNGAGPFAAACLDGVVHLTHPMPSTPQVTTETFSISGTLTPKHPILWVNEPNAANPKPRPMSSIWQAFFDKSGKLKPSKERGKIAWNGPPPVKPKQSSDPCAGQIYSQGYGTLAEAGWSLQVPIPKLRNNYDGGLAMTRVGDQIALLSQARPGGPVLLSLGAYGPAARSARKPAAKKRAAKTRQRRRETT